MAYDDDVEFARNTFTVTTFGTNFLTGASGECRVPDFPTLGETTLFEWNPNTQHLEAVSRESSADLRTCMVGLTVGPGAMCSGSLVVFGYEIDFGFSVNAEEQGCVEVDVPPDFPVIIPEIPCFNTGEDFEALLSRFGVSDASVTKNDDGSWTIDSFPTIDPGLPSGDLVPCTVNLTVGPGAMCDGSIGTPVGDIDYTFSVKADGEACIEAEIPLVDDIDECFDTIDELEDVLDEIDDVIDIDEIEDFFAKNADGSWTILDFL